MAMDRVGVGILCDVDIGVCGLLFISCFVVSRRDVWNASLRLAFADDV